MAAPLMDESRLRHPLEHGVFAASVAVNVLILAGAIAAIAYGADWIARYPRLEKYVTEARAAAIALVFAPPALVLVRNRRRAAVRGNALRLGPRQLPMIYAPFECMCDTLGMSPMPELYLGDDLLGKDDVTHGQSGAYAAWRSRFVVLGVKYLGDDLEANRDVYEFALGRELGRLRLGHVEWWDELLLAYVERIPLLRNPLMHVRTYSHDRYALFLAPGSIRGLVVQASGRLLIKRMDVAEYLDEARLYGGPWTRLANMLHPLPRLALRVQALDEAGLLGREPVAAGPAPAGGMPGVGTPDAAVRPSRST